MGDLRVETRFKNNVLYCALQRQFSGMVKFGQGGVLGTAAACIGIPYQTLSAYLGMRASPYRKRNKGFTQQALRIAEALGEQPSDLFPLSLYKLNFPALHVREYNSEDVLQLQSLSMEDRLIEHPSEEKNPDELKARLDEAIATLGPREQAVIRWRFGLYGGEGMSLHEAGELLGVSGARARQIEAKALRCLRHPERSRSLRKYLNA